MLLNLNEENIPAVLLNARITKKNNRNSGHLKGVETVRKIIFIATVN